MPEDYLSRGLFVPLPENVRISNLRETVLSLANPTTAQAARIHFENHCPIPGSIWNNHILQNPYDIIGEVYDADELEADLTVVAPHLERLFEKYPKCTGKIDREKFETGKEVFVSNNLADLRVTPKNAE